MSQAVDSTTQVFEIGPDAVGKRNVGVVARTDNLVVLAHVWEKGGEAALHSHHSTDASWVVIQGQVVFYGEGDVELARLNRAQGILVPRDVKYWFQSTGDEPLIMVRAAAKLQPGVDDDRVYVTDEK
jgi:mannose-6-phosphate isomerase-like protein (cupin superfamily)